MPSTTILLTRMKQSVDKTKVSYELLRDRLTPKNSNPSASETAKLKRPDLTSKQLEIEGVQIQLTSEINELKRPAPTPKQQEIKAIQESLTDAGEIIDELIEAKLEDPISGQITTLQNIIQTVSATVKERNKRRRFSIKATDFDTRLNDSYTFIIVEQFPEPKDYIAGKIYLCKIHDEWMYIVTPRIMAEAMTKAKALASADGISQVLLSQLYEASKEQKEPNENTSEVTINIKKALLPDNETAAVIFTDNMPRQEIQQANTLYLWLEKNSTLSCWKYLITPNILTTLAPQRLSKQSTLSSHDVPKLALKKSPTRLFALCKTDLIETLAPQNNEYMRLAHLERIARGNQKLVLKDAVSVMLSPIAEAFIQELLDHDEKAKYPEILLPSIFNYVTTITKAKRTNQESEGPSQACNALLYILHNMPAEKVALLYDRLQPTFNKLSINDRAVSDRLTHESIDELKEQRFYSKTQHWSHLNHFKEMHFVLSKEMKDISTCITSVYIKIFGRETVKWNILDPFFARAYEFVVEELVKHQYNDLITTDKQEKSLQRAIKTLLNEFDRSFRCWFSSSRVSNCLLNCYRTFLNTCPDADKEQINKLLCEMLNTQYIDMLADNPHQFNRLQQGLHSTELQGIILTVQRIKENSANNQLQPINDFSALLSMMKAGIEKIPGAPRIAETGRPASIQSSYVTSITQTVKQAMLQQPYITATPTTFASSPACGRGLRRGF